MKDNTSKKGSFKKLAKSAAVYEKYKLKNKSNILVIIMASIAVLIAGLWIITGFGLALSYYLFKINHYIWASLIIVFDIIILRSYLITKI